MNKTDEKKNNDFGLVNGPLRCVSNQKLKTMIHFDRELYAVLSVIRLIAFVNVIRRFLFSHWEKKETKQICVFSTSQFLKSPNAFV